MNDIGSGIRTSDGPGFGLKTMMGVLIAIVIASSPVLPAPSEDDAILKKLEEIEKRLSRLERSGQEPAPSKQKQRKDSEKTVELDELRRQVSVLAQELEKVRSGEEEHQISPERAKSLGLGPSASAVYRKKQGVSIAGYGEMLYENFSASDEGGSSVNRGSELDFLRAILYAGYRFNDKFLFNSEIEFEHATTSRSGSASVEFAYVDYLATDYLALRGGMVLVPMGLTNEFHEPTSFVGARRSETESRIIPSTWRENGFGVVGSAGVFDYRAYVVNGLDATGFSSNGLRGGRQKGSETKASNLAFVGRLDVAPIPGVFFGGSFYRGGSGQGQIVFEGREYDVTTTIGELHGQAQVRGFDFRGLWAKASISDAAELNRFLGLTGSSSVGEDLEGGYLQIGYNILNEFDETLHLMPYFRFEKLNTQVAVPAGFAFDPARERDFFTLGLEFKPIRNIVVKSDFQWIQNRARNGVNQFNVALGYAF